MSLWFQNYRIFLLLAWIQNTDVFGYIMKFCTLHVQSVLSLVRRWPWLQDEVHWLLEGESQIVFDHIWWARPFQQVPLLGKEIICLCILGFISQIFWQVKHILFLLITSHHCIYHLFSFFYYQYTQHNDYFISFQNLSFYIPFCLISVESDHKNKFWTFVDSEQRACLNSNGSYIAPKKIRPFAFHLLSVFIFCLAITCMLIEFDTFLFMSKLLW